MNGRKIIFILAGVAFVTGVILVLTFGGGFSPAIPPRTVDLPERNDTVPELPVMYDYGTKIVYTTDTTVSKTAYIDDCATRGGVFDVCGNTCAPAAQSCTAVCALTCTVKQ